MTQRPVSRAAGFTLIELMTAMSIFLIICGIAFGMLTLSMKRYQSESQLLNTFQEGRFGLDQMVRDIDEAGYPPRNQFAAIYNPPTDPPSDRYAVAAFAWGPPGTYPTIPCQIGGGGGTGCSTPNQDDLIVETDIDPKPYLAGNNDVEWVRYKLVGTTLFRGVVTKPSSGTLDPENATQLALVPYVENVMNNPPADQLASLQAAYPSMFPGGVPVPLFRYFCEAAPQPVDCTSGSPTLVANDPAHVVSIVITLIVKAPFPDLQTGRPLAVQLKGLGRRLNPDY